MNMFEIQKEIYTKVANAVLASYPTCRITNAVIYAPSVFPCAAIVLSDDGTRYDMRDSSNVDNYRDVTLTCDVYTNKVDGKKTEAESIMQVVIDNLFSLNFNMVSCKPINKNAQNYRLTATFTATVDGSGNIYTRR